MPDYKIAKSEKEPFPVKWEEIMGWFLVPKLGEKLTWGMYDFPEKKLTEYDEMEVIGKAEVHGIEGVEIVSVAHNPMECNAIEGDKAERRFVAQLTDTHCRLLAESHTSGGIKKFHTFLDGADFLDNWGYGDDNCGNEIYISAKGDITKDGAVIQAADKPYLLDIVGRYNVEIAGKTYDTVCVIDIEAYDSGVTTEQFLDENGRTILWRRFNNDSWAYKKYKKKWSEMLPDNERMTVNGETYVHWYDCITDYIFR